MTGEGSIRFSETDRGVETTVVLGGEHWAMFHIDIDFAVATGGGPMTVWTSTTPSGLLDVWASLTICLAESVRTFIAEPYGSSSALGPSVNRAKILAFLNEVLERCVSGRATNIVAELDSCLRRSALHRLHKAYDRCLALNTMAEIDSVRGDSIAAHVMGS
jgi:hypothetical protein